VTFGLAEMVYVPLEKDSDVGEVSLLIFGDFSCPPSGSLSILYTCSHCP